MLSVVDVSKSYGSFAAVRRVSLEVRPGQVTGLLGPNGAGKTTLIRMMTAYLTPSSGSIAVCGHDTVDASAAARASIGYLPEAAPLYPEMSVEGYIQYRAGLFGLPRATRRAAVEAVIERCWLREMRRRRISALSKGYRQRTGLAAALLHNPPVIVLDEPTSGLDPTQIRGMRDLICDLGKTRTVLVSSHILPEVEQTCDRVVIIAAGQVRAEGSPAELIDQHAGNAPAFVSVEAAGGERAQAMLAGLPAVASARRVSPPSAPIASFEVFANEFFAKAAGSAPLLAALARAAADAGILLVELRQVRPSLEQVFEKVITSSAQSEVSISQHPQPPRPVLSH